MLVGVAVWQDFILGSQDPDFAMSTSVVDVTGYDFEWWRMVEDMNIAHGGRVVNFVPRNPGIAIFLENSQSVLCNLTKFRGEQADGAVRIIDKIGIIPARSWYRAGFVSRPQRGDSLESAAETFYVEDVDVVERLAPDGVVRDLKFRLALTGASHRR